MTWINDFSKSAANVFKGQVLEGFQPLDFSHFLPLWYHLWIIKIASIIRKLDLEKKNFVELQDLLPPPSNLRTILLKLILSYNANPQEKEDYKLVANFIARMLKESCSNDPFALNSNPFHNTQEIDSIINKVEWKDVNIEEARNIGKLITAAGSLVHGLYNDWATDLGWEAYGPYKVKNENLLIRHFPDLNPASIWSKKLLPSFKDLKIYSLYVDIDWEISFVGCHTISKNGSPVTSMTKAAVYVDNKLADNNMVDTLIIELSDKASLLYRDIKNKDFEDLKIMVMNQEAYQFKVLFDKADVDWGPTEKMLRAIEGKDLLKNIFPHGRLIKTEHEFAEIFGVNKFKQEVLA